MDHPLQNIFRLQIDAAKRGAANAQKASQLALVPLHPDTWAEGVHLARAAFDRTIAMQKGWMSDWAAWMDYAQTIGQADTMPKLVDRSGNIVLQAEAQINGQISDTVELLDNIAVSYAYWANQQLQRHPLLGALGQAPGEKSEGVDHGAGAALKAAAE